MFRKFAQNPMQRAGRWSLVAGGAALLGLLLAAAAACSNDPEPTPVPPTATPAATVEPVAQEPEPMTIVDIAVGAGRFETLVAALGAAGLVETLQGEGPFTVFAPTDDAFAKLPEGTVEALLGDIPALTEVLLYHVVSGDVRASDVVRLDSAMTVQGDAVSIEVDGDMVMVGGARVLVTDIEASNGTIHVIDAVLTPPQELGTIVDIAVGAGRFETLVAALGAAGLVETLQGEGPFTVFAPTDDAFAKLPEGTVEALLGDIPALTEVLLYHVVSGDVRASDVVRLDSAMTVQGDAVSIEVDGDMVMVGGARVLVTDIEASNGTIHVIDAVLTPPQELGTIVDIAVGAGRFETLVAALGAAGLVETLQGEGPFTVFAPTDDAFAKLPEGAVEALLGDIPALTEVLLYHVVSGDVRASDVVRLDSAMTVQGDAVSIEVDGDMVMVGGARVLVTDIEASNGTIHVIDAVLTPPQELGTIVDIAVGAGRFETLVAALGAAGLVETLQGEGPFTVFAPTDDAFAKLPEGTVEALLGDIPALTEVLLYHVVSGDVRASDVVRLDSAMTVQGDAVSIEVDGDMVMVGGARVLVTDIEASNGTIHVIDAVLTPPQELGTIVDIAVGAGRFETLVAALGAAGLVETLQGEGPFTVFAPTDDAFAKLPEGAVEALLGDIPALTEVLLYHVVSGDVRASDVVRLDSAMTVQGDAVSIEVDGDMVMVGGARVLVTDIEASNGTIHVIDAVLIPPRS